MDVLLLRSVNMGSPRVSFFVPPRSNGNTLCPILESFWNLSTWDLSMATISLRNTLIGAGLRLEATCSEATCLRA